MAIQTLGVGDHEDTAHQPQKGWPWSPVSAPRLSSWGCALPLAVFHPRFLGEAGGGVVGGKVMPTGAVCPDTSSGIPLRGRNVNWSWLRVTQRAGQACVWQLIYAQEEWGSGGGVCRGQFPLCQQQPLWGRGDTPIEAPQELVSQSARGMVRFSPWAYCLSKPPSFSSRLSCQTPPIFTLGPPCLPSWVHGGKCVAVLVLNGGKDPVCGRPGF